MSASTAPLLSELRIGQRAHQISVRLHFSASNDQTDAAGTPSAPALKSTKSKVHKQRRVKAAATATAAAVTASKHSSPDSALLRASAGGLVRCVLSDASASVVAEVSANDLRTLTDEQQQHQQADDHTPGVIEVEVSGALQLDQGRAIFKVSSLESSPCVSAVSLSRAAHLSSLLHFRSGSDRGAGVWLLRLVAGSLFVLLQPSSPDPDESENRPPHRLLRANAGHAESDASLQRCARSALHAATSIRADDYVLLPDVRSAPFLYPTPADGQKEEGAAVGMVGGGGQRRPHPARVLSTMYCALLVPGVELTGDAAAESTFEREHWSHVARAITDQLHPVWAESLTQILAGLSGWVERWAHDARADNKQSDNDKRSAVAARNGSKRRTAQVAPTESSDDEEEVEDEEEGEPLFDETGHVLPSTSDAADSKPNNIDSADAAMNDVGESAAGTNSTLPPLPLSVLAGGVGPSAPQYVRRLVRDLSASLSRVEVTLSKLRAEQADAEEEDDEEDEDDEDGEAMSDDDEANLSAATPSARRNPKGAAPTSAAKLITGSAQPSGEPPAQRPRAVPDDAKVRRLRAQVRTLLGQIENGKRDRIPVTVLTGFLGAGKTSLLNHLLGANHGLRIGVVVNDFSHVNVDAALLHSARPEELVELSNGCICCTLRADLFSSVVELVASDRVDYVCVESTGLGEPAPVAATFTFEIDEDNATVMQSYGLQSLSQIVRLDCIATVVDSPAVHQALTKRMQSAADLTQAVISAESAAAAAAPGAAKAEKQKLAAAAAAALSSIRAAEAANKSVQSLLIEQLEFCNVLVLNKSDLLRRDQIKLVEEFVRLNNSHAQCVHAQYGRVDPKVIIGSGKFDEQQSLNSPLLAFAAAEWHSSLQASRLDKLGSAAVNGEAAEYGIRSFVYTRRVGFSTARLHQLLQAYEHGQGDSLPQQQQSAKKKKNNKQPAAAGAATAAAAASVAALSACFRGVLRVKGVFWIGDNSAAVGIWQATTPGTAVTVTHAGGWLLDLSATDCVTSGCELLSLQSRWHPRVADRYTQLVFIGAGDVMDEAAIRAALDRCALTDTEMVDALGEGQDGQSDDDEADADADDEQSAAHQHEHGQTGGVQFPLLQKVLDFDADPNAAPTCALQP